MYNNLAPIGISVYSRLQHLQKTIEALRDNALASWSELFIFSDGPKPGDEEKVALLRRYLHTIDGFKKVHIFERDSNNRIENSRGGISMLLKSFGKVIALEEDIVTAPGFLTFINQGLAVYEGNNKVFNISGYCPPISIPADYQEDVFFCVE